MAGRPLGKKTREQKREETRRLILDTAMDLFFEKGYDQTTTRDILVRSGILNGSLYNRFKSKEDILLAIIAESLEGMLTVFEQEFPDNKHPILAFSVPGAVLMYIASHSVKAAELIYSAGNSVAAVDMYLGFYHMWSERIFGQSPWDPEAPIPRMKVSAVVGAVESICGRYATGVDVPFRDAFEIIVRLAASILDIPVLDVSQLCDEVVATMDSIEIVVCGSRLTEFPDYR